MRSASNASSFVAREGWFMSIRKNKKPVQLSLETGLLASCGARLFSGTSFSPPDGGSAPAS
jgi:hypothetical protein